MIAAALVALALTSEVLATRPLPRGTVLTAEMVEAASGTDLTRHLGKQLRRPVFAGKPIAVSDVEAPDLVARQQPISVVFRKRGLVLSVPGRAVGAGALGETITVLTEGRRRPLRAVVTAAGEVEVLR